MLWRLNLVLSNIVHICACKNTELDFVSSTREPGLNTKIDYLRLKCIHNEFPELKNCSRKRNVWILTTSTIGIDALRQGECNGSQAILVNSQILS